MSRNKSAPATYPTALVAQGAGGLARLIHGPRALFPCRVSGPALPCRCALGDNLTLHRAIVQAQPGAVLVCDARGEDGVAFFGELMALECIRRKIAGLVIHGAVRDAEALERIGFPVFCEAQSPLSSMKTRVGTIGMAVSLCGVRIGLGDQIIADRDGVLTVPAASWQDVLTGVKSAQAREHETKRRMEAGQSLSSILGLNL
jgi:4-hydroxy-4-methyl-2-oxoglutarate aldolase